MCMTWDCEVMDGSLEGVTKASDMKSLQEIRGTLLLKSELSFEREIKLRMLKMQDFFTANSLSFPNIDAKRLEMVNVLGPKVSFGNEPEEFVMLESSIDFIAGITGSLLKHLDLTGSSFESFSLSEARDVKDIRVIRVPNVALKTLLPNLQYAESVTISNVGTKYIELGLETIAGRMDILNNKELQGIYFPSLTYVADEIRVTKNPMLAELRATRLEHGRLSIYDKLQAIEIPTTLTWSGRSHFNANQFYPTYAEAFRGLEWNQEICPKCGSTSFNVTEKTLPAINECGKVGSLFINQDSPTEVNLDNLESIEGDLKIQNYSGYLSMVSLKTISGSLSLENIDGLTENFSCSLETVGSLKFSRVSQDLRFSDLEVLDSISMAHSSMKELSGIHAIKLNLLMLYNSAMPAKFPLFTLQEVADLAVRMTAISNFEPTFSQALVVTGSFEFSESLVRTFDINFQVNGTFSLRYNPNLVTVSFLSQPSFNFYQEDPPQLRAIHFIDRTLDFNPASHPKDDRAKWTHDSRPRPTATHYIPELSRFSDPALQSQLRELKELVHPSTALYSAMVLAALVGTLLVLFYSK
ncbi:hypothetical protein DSO57_1013637 [Entomophthora muscae]|nr:hypothetical protein DSO57_1013637 [Entomophthora muscae]